MSVVTKIVHIHSIIPLALVYLKVVVTTDQNSLPSWFVLSCIRAVLRLLSITGSAFNFMESIRATTTSLSAVSPTKVEALPSLGAAAANATDKASRDNESVSFRLRSLKGLVSNDPASFGSPDPPSCQCCWTI